MAGKFEINIASQDQYRFNLKASNGQVILTSQTYKSKNGANNGIKSVQKNFSDDSKYDRRTAKNGKHYFVLKAGNNQIIGNSQMYSSATSMEKGIKSVKNNGSTTVVEDLT